MSFLKKPILWISILVSSMVLPGAVYADLQFEVYGGVASNSASFGSEYFTPNPFQSPPNTLGGSTDQTAFAPGFGVSYGFPMESLTQVGNQTYVLHDITLGVNVYNLSSNYTGPVFLNGDPATTQNDYNMGIDSWRVMLDGEFDFHPFYNGWVMPFGEVGIGEAINTMHYAETSAASSGIILDPHTTNSLAYEFGGGVKVPVTQHANISLRYLYTNYGLAEGTTPVSPTPPSTGLSSPLEVHLHASSFLLGFNYGLGNM